MAPTAYEPPQMSVAVDDCSLLDEENRSVSWSSMDGVEAADAGRHYYYFQEFVKSPETGYVMNSYFEQFYQTQLQHFDVRDDDIYLITFPRSGTTWSQELIWCIVHDLDFEGAKEKLIKRFPFLEFDAMLPPGGWSRLPPSLIELAAKAQALGTQDGALKVTLPGKHLDFIATCPSPRLLKTHLPLALLPPDVRRKKCKIIYVARDARDVCVSSYHLFRGIAGYTGTLDEYVANFLNGLAMWGPHWQHVLDHWIMKDEPNVLFLTYEEMKADISDVIRRVSSFLGKQMSPSDVERLADHVSFANMKSNEAVSFEKNYAQLTERILKPVQEMGLPLDALVAIAVEGRLTGVPVRKLLRLVVRGKIPLGLVSAFVAARIKGRRPRLSPAQISALTGGTLTPEFCSQILQIGGAPGTGNGNVACSPVNKAEDDVGGTEEGNVEADKSENSQSDSRLNNNEESFNKASAVIRAENNHPNQSTPSRKKSENKEASPPKNSKKDTNKRSGFATNFFRKGVVGDGRTTLSPSQNVSFDEYDRKHFGGTGLPYGKH